MRYLLVILVCLIVSCEGVLWEGVPKSTADTDTVTITIRLFENDPLWEYYKDYWANKQEG